MIFYKYKAPILLYHHVSGEGDRTITVSPHAFGRQMEQLAQGGKRVVSLETWLEAGRQFWRPVAITFDDGGLDTYTEAFPVLQRYRLPAAVFVVTDWVDRPGFLRWGHLREMATAGWTIGSHTKSHSYLPDLPSSKWEEEIRGSKEILEDKLQRPVNLFSYPVGGYTEEIMACVRRAGYRAACTTNRGDFFSFDPYRLTRIKMTEASHPFVVWVKASGHYEHFKRSKPSH